jgi:hypothetical protein
MMWAVTGITLLWILNFEHKVEVSELFDGALLVHEHASVSVGAEESLVELLAHLGLVLGASRLFFAHEVLASMGELAFGSVSAEVLLNPVLAHLCLVLGLVDLGQDGRLGRGFPEVALGSRALMGKIRVGGFS